MVSKINQNYTRLPSPKEKDMSITFVMYHTHTTRLKFNSSHLKIVVGRLLSFWEGNFSGAMLNLGRCKIMICSFPTIQNIMMLPIYSIVLVGIVQVSQRHAWQSRSSVTLRLHVQRRGKLGTSLLTEGSLRLNVSPISRSLFFVRQNYIIRKAKFDSNFSECF